MLNNNNDLQNIWKNLKSNIIMTLTAFELGNFKLAYKNIKQILQIDIKNLREFLKKNSDNLLDLNAPRSIISQYLFSFMVGIIMISIVSCLIYRSPKLQNKKFV